MKKIALLSVMLIAVVSGCAQYQTQQQATGQPQTAAPTQTGKAAIAIKGFAFNPSVLTVKAGTAVVWTNEDSAPHRIKSDSFNSGNLNNGMSFEFKFNDKGTFDYVCGIHPSMKGKVIVEQ